jgi:hypothetical protein
MNGSTERQHDWGRTDHLHPGAARHGWRARGGVELEGTRRADGAGAAGRRAAVAVQPDHRNGGVDVVPALVNRGTGNITSCGPKIANEFRCKSKQSICDRECFLGSRSVLFFGFRAPTSRRRCGTPPTTPSRRRARTAPARSCGAPADQPSATARVRRRAASDRREREKSELRGRKGEG